MSDIDLTEVTAVLHSYWPEAGGQATYAAFERARAAAAKAVTPLIERQVREQVAREIERAAAVYRTEAERRVSASDREFLDACAMSADGCARIARGGTA